LKDIPNKIDMVNIFRPSDQVEEVVDKALEIRPRYIWMQLGIENEKAKEKAEANNIEVVMDRCLYIEHRRLI
ncbi:MAG: CoA-binding protein, partial [Candidatus Thorarchaeota archaeon]